MALAVQLPCCCVVPRSQGRTKVDSLALLSLIHRSMQQPAQSPYAQALQLASSQLSCWNTSDTATDMLTMAVTQHGFDMAYRPKYRGV